jgi:DNA-directed RNA polymerase subunit RPC12/RpoP
MITVFTHPDLVLGGLIDFFPEVEIEETGYACSCGHQWAVQTRGMNQRPVKCPACGHIESYPR